MIYTEYQPTSVLADLVECYWSLRGPCPSANAGGHRVLPDGCMDLIFETVGGGAGAPRGFVVGAMPRAAVVPRKGSAVTWGIRFRPGGASAFLDVPAHELTGRTPDLENFWDSGVRELRQRLGETPTPEGQTRVLDEALVARMMPEGADPVVLAVRNALEAHHGNVQIAELARRAGLSTRQLRRRFADAVGLSPKLLARILRFRAGVEALARAPGLEKGRLALRLGYYDQAHFGRDFRELAGVSPGGYLEERRGVRFVQANRPEESHLGPPHE